MPLRQSRLFKTEFRTTRLFTWGDGITLILVAVIITLGVRLAVSAPEVIKGPEISLSPTVLPWYTLFSVGRMVAAYLLSIIFTLVYGRVAAYNQRAEKVLMPLLDVLQSVPILSFLPVVLLSLSAVLPMHVAAELASIVLIFTSQVWNMVFAWYQSLTTIPKELNEASAIFKQNGWLRFKNLELPFAMISLVWNSIMSFAGGWFFLMAAEIFTVGARDFRLAGIGAYLQEAANQGDYPAIIWGLISLILVIVVLDQFLWRPLLAWSERFKVEMVQGDEPATSWFYEALQSSRMIEVLQQNVVTPLSNRLDMWLQHRLPAGSSAVYNTNKLSRFSWMAWFIPGLFLAFGTYHTISMVLALPLDQWAKIGTGLVATTLRVAAALLIAIGWTIPAGVAIGTNRRLAAFFQPLIQITASIPATALFPVLLVFLLALPGGLNMAAVLLMLMGTQWYLLFNIIAGVNAIPQDLKYTASLLQLNGIERWKTLILPALFPYLITGAITASGGAWNASIVAEYVHFGGQIVSTTGIGSLIAHATAGGDYPLLLAATLSMILAVVLINRLIWRRLYRMAEENYRME